MFHEIHTIIDFKVRYPYTLWIRFDDESEQVIDFLPLLRGELYSPLQDIYLFNQVRLDVEAGNLVWPNNVDFDPATLHDWPDVGEAMIAMARTWPEFVAESAVHLLVTA